MLLNIHRIQPLYFLTRIFVFYTRAMKIKLTLTVEKEVIEKAKIYAKKTDRSLSEIIENYLNEIIDESSPNAPISPHLKKIVGCVTLPNHFNEKKAIRAYLEKKHL